MAAERYLEGSAEEDQPEFLEERHFQDLVEKHSEFIGFPTEFYLEKPKKTEEGVEVDEFVMGTAVSSRMNPVLIDRSMHRDSLVVVVSLQIDNEKVVCAVGKQNLGLDSYEDDFFMMGCKGLPDETCEVLVCINKQSKPRGIIGIDLGTTNSCVTMMEGSSSKVLDNFEDVRPPPPIIATTNDGQRPASVLAKRQAVMEIREHALRHEAFDRPSSRTGCDAKGHGGLAVQGGQKQDR